MDDSRLRKIGNSHRIVQVNVAHARRSSGRFSQHFSFNGWDDDVWDAEA
jgi:hypothetical protein